MASNLLAMASSLSLLVLSGLRRACHRLRSRTAGRLVCIQPALKTVNMLAFFDMSTCLGIFLSFQMEVVSGLGFDLMNNYSTS